MNRSTGAVGRERELQSLLSPRADRRFVFSGKGWWSSPVVGGAGGVGTSPYLVGGRGHRRLALCANLALKGAGGGALATCPARACSFEGIPGPTTSKVGEFWLRKALFLGGEAPSQRSSSPTSGSPHSSTHSSTISEGGITSIHPLF